MDILYGVSRVRPCGGCTQALKRCKFGDTPLHTAMQKVVSPEMIQMLCKTDAGRRSMLLKGSRGRTPLHCGLQHEETEAMRLKRTRMISVCHTQALRFSW
jgi:hypothetical protein